MYLVNFVSALMILCTAAILELRYPVYFTEKIRPICLPRRSHSHHHHIYYDSHTAQVAGWGRLGLGGIDWASQLLETSVFVLNNEICQTIMSMQGQQAWELSKGFNNISA